MINFFDSLYALIIDKNDFLKRIRYYSLLRFIIRKTANIVLPLYFKITSKHKNNNILTFKSNSKSQNIIVSLTSFPARINTLWLVIETLLRQKRKPNRIILWLSKQQFSSKYSLPGTLLKQQKRGLEIRFVDEDLGSHKKYYYTLKELNDSILITVDDDIFYDTRLVEELLMWHNEFPTSVIARYAYKIAKTEHDIKSYREWGTIFFQDEPGFDIFFGSGGGTLFPSGIMPMETLNKDIFLKLCPYADDVWLNAMCQLNQIKIFRPTGKQRSLLPVIIRKNKTLSKNNLIDNQNDIQINNVRDYYKSTYNIDPFGKRELEGTIQ